MQAVILCGGKGLRMGYDANFTSKPLVKIGGMPILWHIMKSYKYFNIDEFVLCLGHNGEAIKDYFINMNWRNNDFQLKKNKNSLKLNFLNSTESWNIIFADTGPETMTGGRIKRIQKYVDGDEFMLTYGDGISDIPISELYKFHKEKGKIATVTGIKPRSGYGVMSVEDGIVSRFEEKPIMDNWINAGYFVLNKAVFDYISDDEKCVWEEEPLRQLVLDRELAIYQHNGFWQSIDTVKDAQAVNDMWNNNNRPWVRWQLSQNGSKS
ncbi:MAG: sugar phosphate nucleotidyltransferase [Bacillota bacterium]|nr:sugar phosphate nucleotidyltransferase [Bacillota bacterium]